MDQELINDYRQVLRIRRFEEEVRDLRTSGEIVGSVHLCIGQEAVPVGAVHELDLSRDAVFATYRGHGWAVACGTPLEALFAELLGRESGVNGGRGGSAYFSDPDHGFYGENSIVGAGAPIATGAALAARYDGSGRVVLCVMGDGAVNQGSVHEAMNFAAVTGAPVVFVIENNRYSELTPTRDMVRVARLVDRAACYGLGAEQVDGNDVLAVRDAVGAAVTQARDGGGPGLVEAMTERLVGHYIGDAETYRAPGELEAAREREPVVRLRAELLGAGVGTDVLDDVAREVDGELLAARQGALGAPVADPGTARRSVYA
jgi:TPP-dependent pyruvate/acetoin dehydrogenase alpha subunit